MCDGERGGHRYACLQKRYARLGCDGENERDQQDESDFIEKRYTHDKSGE